MGGTPARIECNNARKWELPQPPKWLEDLGHRLDGKNLDQELRSKLDDFALSDDSELVCVIRPFSLEGEFKSPRGSILWSARYKYLRTR